MPDKHPYVNSPGNLTKVLDQLRRSFPTTFNSETLKKLGLAPNNESYIINTIRFLGLIDDQDARTVKAQTAFVLHEKAAFEEAFSKIAKDAYRELFELYGDSTWELDQSKLIAFFRQHDQTSDVVGSLQARTFQVVAEYGGHASVTSQTPAKPNNRAEQAAAPKRPKPRATVAQNSQLNSNNGSDTVVVSAPLSSEKNIGLTVRIEINLPLANDQDTYDKIFKSIRENLLNG